MNLQQILKEIGLNGREVNVYLAVLELGQSTVLPISKKAGVKRTHCYDILDSLEKKRLISFIVKSNRRRYSAEDPRKLRIRLNNQLIFFDSVLPELNALYNNQLSGKPKIRFYEGITGIVDIYESLAYAEKLDAVGSPLLIEQSLGKYLKQTIENVITPKLRIRELIPHRQDKAFYHKYYQKPYHEYRFLPHGVNLKTDMLIFENKVVMISYGENLHAVVIEDSNIVDTQKELFEIIWNNTKKL